MKENQIVLVNRLAFLFHKPSKDMIVACKDPRDGKTLIKRITKVVGKNYFVSGDNKEHSTDSRDFGMIEQSDILGKVLI